MDDMIAASHILLLHKDSIRSESDRSKEDALKQMEGILAQLKDGADFFELAKEFSECPSSNNGGYLGDFGRDMMEETFEEAAFSLAVDETSEIIETPFGFHLILRTK
jgi:parvulin-like peptidyl-prolyl isomerase